MSDNTTLNTDAELSQDHYTFSVLLRERHGSDPGHINVLLTDKNANKVLSHHFGMVGSDVAEVTNSVRSVNKSLMAAGAVIPAFVVGVLSDYNVAVSSSLALMVLPVGLGLAPVLGKNTVLNELPTTDSSSSHGENSLITLKANEKPEAEVSFKRLDYNISKEAYQSLAQKIKKTDQTIRPYSLGLRTCISVSKDFCKMAGVKSGRAVLTTPNSWFKTVSPQEPDTIYAEPASKASGIYTMLNKLVGGKKAASKPAETLSSPVSRSLDLFK